MIRAWIAPASERIFPLANPGRRRTLRLEAARGERVSFQVGVRSTGTQAPAEIEAYIPDDQGLDPRIRIEGLVPVRHHTTGIPREHLDGPEHIPGYVPDPLFDESAMRIEPDAARAFWVDIDVPRDGKPGERAVDVEIRAPGGSDEVFASVRVTIDVSPVLLEPRHGFHVTHWVSLRAVAHHYALKPWGAAFWRIWEEYVRNYTEHGNNVLVVPLFTALEEADGSPRQMLGVQARADGGYDFDWSRVRRYVRTARRHGVTHFEWPHLFSPWGAEHAVDVLGREGDSEKPLWRRKTSGTSDTYKTFLAAFLPALRGFLERESIDRASFFHVSDEPNLKHLDRYGEARKTLREVAPWMPVMDALSDIEFARRGLTDIPVVLTSRAREFVEAGIPAWAYYCCAPRAEHLNRFMDTPLTKVRMTAWVLYRLGFDGFLHWGFNWWHECDQLFEGAMIDPFAVNDAGNWPQWPHGDPFVVYPGEKGPLDSIRWEVFALSLQDYALLQTLGVSPDDPLLRAVRDFDDAPWTPSWHERARHALLFERQ